MDGSSKVLNKQNSINNNSNISQSLYKVEKNYPPIQACNYDYSKMNNFLQMYSIPYLGVYALDYIFFTPNKIFYVKNPSAKLITSLPNALYENIIGFRNRFKVDTDYFNITMDGNFILEKYKQSNIFHFLRVNAILHPYIFYDIEKLNPRQEHKTLCFCALFTDDKSVIDSNTNYIADSNEPDGLRINPESLVNDSNGKELILHFSDDNFPALSPNNMAFLLDLKNNITSFYLLAALTYGKSIIKLVITKINILINPEIKMLKPLNNAIDSMLKSDYIYEKKTVQQEQERKNSEAGKVTEHNSLGIEFPKSRGFYDINNPIDNDFSMNKQNLEANSNNIKNIDINNNQFMDINAPHQLQNNSQARILKKESNEIIIDVKNTDNLSNKIKIENFLTQLQSFENIWRVSVDFLRGFIIKKIFFLINDQEIKKVLISKNILFETIIEFIKVFFLSLFGNKPTTQDLAVNFININKLNNNNKNINDLSFHLIPSLEDYEEINDFNEENFTFHENINNINLNQTSSISVVNHNRKFNDYYPSYNSYDDLMKNCNLKDRNKSNLINSNINSGNSNLNMNLFKTEDDLILGEYGLLRFYKFIEYIFKSPQIDKFGQKLFEDYLELNLNDENFFFLRLIDMFFDEEINKVINICNSYKIFFNEFGCEVPLSETYTKNNLNSPNHTYELTNNECKEKKIFIF